MRFTGQGPAGMPFQGPGGMQAPMNPMQKSWVPQGSPPPQGNPWGAPHPGFSLESAGNVVSRDQYMSGVPEQFQAFSQNNYTGMQRQSELKQAENALMRAQMYGADPYTIASLERKVSDLRGAIDRDIQMEMANKQKQFNDRQARASAPGVGRGASRQVDSPGWQAYAQNFGIDQQLLASLLTGNRGGMPGRR